MSKSTRLSVRVSKSTRLSVKVVRHQGSEAAKGDRDGNQYGKSTVLCITHFCNELFVQGAGRADAELAAALAAEYPSRKVIQSVSAYRSYFNKGVHGFGYATPLSGADRLVRVGGSPAAEEAKPVAKPTKAAKGKGKQAKAAAAVVAG